MIKFAEKNDVPEIMAFIDSNWKRGHILAKNVELFKYLYITGEKRVNFAISRNEKSDINGILGFIPYDEDCRHVSLALWKALSCQDSFIGMELFEFLVKKLNPQLIATPGINMETSGEIYLFFNYEVGRMNHYYRINPKVSYKIAQIRDRELPKFQPSEAKIKEIKSVAEIPGVFKYDSTTIPKNKEYLNRRYFMHPIFKYDVRMFNNELIVISRVQSVGNAKCINIVDMLGNYSEIHLITGYFDELLSKNNVEYIDCYNIGIPTVFFEKAGFTEIRKSSNVIPGYFSPFLQKNIDIYYSSSRFGITLFKGDGDQDRPN